MASPLSKDALIKANIRDNLIAYVYDPPAVMYSKALNSLVERNWLLSGGKEPGFIFRGDAYLNQRPLNTTSTGRPVPLRSPHPEILPELKKLIQERSFIFKHEQPQVRGYLTTVLNQVTYLPDLLKILPDCLHHPINQSIWGIRQDLLKDGLTPVQIQDLQAKGIGAMDLMRKRLVLNLIQQA